MAQPTGTPLSPETSFDLLARLFSCRNNDKRVLAGVNDDDCAVLHWPADCVIATTDFVNASPVSLELGIGDLSVVGRLAVASNIADLAGTGAVPRCILLNVMLPRDSTLEDLLLIARGARLEAERWDVPIVGGDTKLGRHTAVAATAIGDSDCKEWLRLKFQAQPGDEIWISGELGSCCAAVAGWRDFRHIDPWRTWASQVLTVPSLPLEKSAELNKLKASRAGTDVSDGLGMDLRQMCASSGVGARVFPDMIPVHPNAAVVARRLGVPPWAPAFGIGGDFAFVAAVSPARSEDAARIGLHRIGMFTESPDLLIEAEPGRMVRMPSGGHEDGRRMSFEEETRYLIEEVRCAIA